MQKAGLISNLGTLYLMDIETGETTPWDGITEISLDDLEVEEAPLIPQEVVDKMNEAAVSICVAGQTLYDEIKAILMSSAIKNIEDSMKDILEDDKTPNPIYIPKHIQHRKKGRR